METAPKPARRRLNFYTKAERRERIFAHLRLGWTYEKIALEEGVSERRIRQIVTEALRRQELDDPTDYALIQLMRLDCALEVAAKAVDGGDLRAIDSLIKVLERIDRYRKAGAAKVVYDDAARERLFAKLSRLAARFSAQGRAVAKAPSPPGDAPRP